MDIERQKAELREAKAAEATASDAFDRVGRDIPPSEMTVQELELLADWRGTQLDVASRQANLLLRRRRRGSMLLERWGMTRS